MSSYRWWWLSWLVKCPPKRLIITFRASFGKRYDVNSDMLWGKKWKSYPVMRSGSLVLSFLTQQRPSIRPADEEQKRPTAVPFKTVPSHSLHTWDHKWSCAYATPRQQPDSPSPHATGHQHLLSFQRENAVSFTWIDKTSQLDCLGKSRSYLQVGQLKTWVKTKIKDKNKHCRFQLAAPSSHFHPLKSHDPAGMDMWQEANLNALGHCCLRWNCA